jgi:hypothetical protein
MIRSVVRDRPESKDSKRVKTSNKTHENTNNSMDLAPRLSFISNSPIDKQCDLF